MKKIICLIQLLIIAMFFSCTDMVKEIKDADEQDREVLTWDATNWNDSEWGD